jgi:hypothetical protein
VLKLLLRIVPVGDALLTVLATDAASAEPQTLELQVDEFTTAPAAADGAGGGGAPAPAPLTAAAAAKSFTHLDRLCSSISMALAQLTAASAAGAGGSSSSSTKQASGGSAAAPAARQQGRDEGGTRRPQPQPQPQQPDRDDPLRIGPPRRPMRVGACAPRCALQQQLPWGLWWHGVHASHVCMRRQQPAMPAHTAAATCCTCCCHAGACLQARTTSCRTWVAAVAAPWALAALAAGRCR